MFTLQSRQKIVKSSVNRSVSKQLWSFSKTKRFARIKTECPVAFYQQDCSTISNKKIRFSASKRKVFTEITDAPLPGNYQTCKQKVKSVPFFGQSRDKCIFRSYISRQIANNPGPNKYETQQPRRSKGYSMRPKTAHQRNYFIQDRERMEVPDPSKYVIEIQRGGMTNSSKFRSTLLGNFGLMKKSKRFQSYDTKTPGPSSYHPNKVGLVSQTKGGTIGNQLRKSFIDRIKKCANTTGPGNYELPTQFGHYLDTHAIGLTHGET